MNAKSIIDLIDKLSESTLPKGISNERKIALFSDLRGKVRKLAEEKQSPPSNVATTLKEWRIKQLKKKQ